MQYTVDAEWVLNHQFLRVAMRDTAQVPAYEAHVYIGRDNLSERYVAHWLDLFGVAARVWSMQATRIMVVPVARLHRREV